MFAHFPPDGAVIKQWRRVSLFLRGLCCLQRGARLRDSGGRARMAEMSPLMAFFCSATFYALQCTDGNRPVGGKRSVEEEVSATYGSSACVTAGF